MKLSDYREKLAQSPEYIEAEKRLHFRFEIGNAVLRGRIKRGWSQTDLAIAVGTKQANISRIEAGLANPTLDLIQRLCEVLNLELKLLEPGKDSVVEMRIGDLGKFVKTETLERVDDQPENLFCPSFRTSSEHEMKNGVLE